MFDIQGVGGPDEHDLAIGLLHVVASIELLRFLLDSSRSGNFPKVVPSRNPQGE